MNNKTAQPASVRLRWQKIYRVVAAKHPPINVFENIVGARQMEMAWYIEGLTNDRLRDESGAAPLVPPEDRLQAPGASIVMAAFTHIGRPSRFSDGSYGVYYAARSLETAVRETGKLAPRSDKASGGEAQRPAVLDRCIEFRLHCLCPNRMASAKASARQSDDCLG